MSNNNLKDFSKQRISILPDKFCNVNLRNNEFNTDNNKTVNDRRSNLSNANRINAEQKLELNNFNNINFGARREFYNHAEGPSYSSSIQSSNIKPKKFDRNKNHSLYDRVNSADSSTFYSFHNYSTNNYSSMTALDNSSLRRFRSINLNDCDRTSINDIQSYKSDYRSNSTMNLVANKEYSKYNLSNHLLIDNQSIQYHNNDLFKHDDHYSIKKCENCQILILTNDNAELEIGKLNSDIDKLKEKYEFEIIQLKNEIKSLKSIYREYGNIDYPNDNFRNIYEKIELQPNNYKLEINNYELKNNKCESEIKKYELEINNYEILINKYELKINKYESEINDYNSEIDKYKSEINKYKSEINKYKSETLSKNLSLIIKNSESNHEISKREILEKNNELLITENSDLKNDNITLKESIEIKTEKLISEIIKYKLKYKEMKMQIQNKNLKSKINKYRSEIKTQLNCNNLDRKIIKLIKENAKLKFNFKYRSVYKKLISNIKKINNLKKNFKRKSKNKPIGFENPKGYCFLNCVVQQFYSCKDFRNKLIEYHNGSYIAKSTCKDDLKIFVSNFCKLMDEINKRNENKVLEYVSKVQDFFEESSFGDDVIKCFTKILNLLITVVNSEDILVENLFCGEVNYTIICMSCQKKLNESQQIFNTIALPIPKSTQQVPLEDVIKMYFQKCPVESSDMICSCPAGSKNLYSITEYKNMPVYLFIYLNRGSFYENGEKNNTFIICDKILNFPNSESFTEYNLISTIDHIGDNYGGHYYVKSCFETNQWWILNDSFVNIINEDSIITNKTTVFLFKRC